jgi:hypothetical protein
VPPPLKYQLLHRKKPESTLVSLIGRRGRPSGVVIGDCGVVVVTTKGQVPATSSMSPRQRYREIHKASRLTRSQCRILSRKSDKCQSLVGADILLHYMDKHSQQRLISATSLHEVEEVPPSFVYAAVGRRRNTPLLKLRILDKFYFALLDSGADVSFMDKNLVEELRSSGVHLDDSSETLGLLKGQAATEGTIVVNFSWDGGRRRQIFRVVESMNRPIDLVAAVRDL